MHAADNSVYCSLCSLENEVFSVQLLNVQCSICSVEFKVFGHCIVQGSVIILYYVFCKVFSVEHCVSFVVVIYAVCKVKTIASLTGQLGWLITGRTNTTFG